MAIIETYDGSLLDVQNPTKEGLSIRNIACGLSQAPRWAGQMLCRNWKVASHSILVSRLVSKKLRVEALLHDATEAFLCDMPKPIKSILPDYIALEKSLDSHIRRQYNLPDRMSFEVLYADSLALVAEFQYIKIGKERHIDQILDRLYKLFPAFLPLTYTEVISYAMDLLGMGSRSVCAEFLRTYRKESTH